MSEQTNQGVVLLRPKFVCPEGRSRTHVTPSVALPLSYLRAYEKAPIVKDWGLIECCLRFLQVRQRCACAHLYLNHLARDITNCCHNVTPLGVERQGVKSLPFFERYSKGILLHENLDGFLP